MNDEHIRI